MGNKLEGTENENKPIDIDYDNYRCPVAQYRKMSIKSIIGFGNTSLVYKALYEEKKVAFKCYKITTLHDGIDFSEFEKEVAIYSVLKHRNVVKIFGIVKEPPNVGILLEYCKYGDLSNFLESNPRVTYLTRMEILKEVCEGMIFLHSQSISQASLSIQDIFIKADLRVKLGKIKDEHLQPSQSKVEKKTTEEDENREKANVFHFGLLMWRVLTNTFYTAETVQKSSKKEEMHESTALKCRMLPDITLLKSRKIIPDVFHDDTLGVLLSCLDFNESYRPRFVDVSKMISKVLTRFPRRMRRVSSVPWPQQIREKKIEPNISIQNQQKATLVMKKKETFYSELEKTLEKFHEEKLPNFKYVDDYLRQSNNNVIMDIDMHKVKELERLTYEIISRAKSVPQHKKTRGLLKIEAHAETYIAILNNDNNKRQAPATPTMMTTKKMKKKKNGGDVGGTKYNQQQLLSLGGGKKCNLFFGYVDVRKNRCGFGKEFNVDGKLIFSGHYKNNLRHGEGKEFDDRGVVTKKGIWNKGE